MKLLGAFERLEFKDMLNPIGPLAGSTEEKKA